MTGNLSQDRKRKRIPRSQQLILHDAAAVFYQDMRTIYDLITRRLAAPVINDRQRTVAVHRDAFTFTALHRLQIEVFNSAVLPGFVFRRLFQTRRTTDVERAHRELRAWFTNRLGSDDAYSLANLHWTTCRQVASIALDTAATSRFAGQHRTNSHTLHA